MVISELRGVGGERARCKCWLLSSGACGSELICKPTKMSDQHCHVVTTVPLHLAAACTHGGGCGQT